MREETEAERQRRLEETRKEIAAETARALAADPRRGRRPDARGGLAGRRQHARRRARPRADRGGDRRARLLARSRSRPSPWPSRTASTPRRSSAPRRTRAGSPRCTRRSRDFAAAVGESPELRAVLRNPQLESSAKAAILADLAGDEEPLFTQLPPARRREGPRGRARGDRARVRAADGARGAAPDRRADDRARADATTEAQAILQQIEEAAGRKVEATRSVDPSLVGGIVLQAGSLRVDASVRGRLERLRHELVEELRRRTL